MSRECFNVLFFCVGDSSRSIMAEALLNHLAGGRFRAFSASTEPAGETHLLTLQLLRSLGLPVQGLGSKSLAEFRALHDTALDFAISVGGRPADETWRGLPGNPVKAHWVITDPLAGAADESQRKKLFYRSFAELENRIRLFVLANDRPKFSGARGRETRPPVTSSRL